MTDTVYRGDDLKKRTKEFALRVIRLFRALPRTEEARVLGRQVLRSATSVPRITERSVEQGREPNLFPEWGLLLRRWMKRFFGLNCSWRAARCQ